MTHVRNLLAAATIIEGGDKDKVPVRGGPSTGTISVVEKIGGSWRIRREDGNNVVQELAPLSEELQSNHNISPRCSELIPVEAAS
jgi:hypothetical protein